MFARLQLSAYSGVSWCKTVQDCKVATFVPHFIVYLIYYLLMGSNGNILVDSSRTCTRVLVGSVVTISDALPALKHPAVIALCRLLLFA